MSDTHVAYNLDLSEIILSLGIDGNEMETLGYENTFTRPSTAAIVKILAETLKNAPLPTLRKLYRSARVRLINQNWTAQEINEEIGNAVNSYCTFGCYRPLHGYSVPVLMVAEILTEEFDARRTGTFTQTDETREWGGWDGTHRHDYQESVAWLESFVKTWS